MMGASHAPATLAPGGTGVAGPRRSRRAAGPAWWFLGVEAVLIAAAVNAPPQARTTLVIVAAGLGVAATAGGIRWHRPAAGAGWWLLAASAALSLLGVVTVAATTGALSAEVVDLTSTAPPLPAVAVALFVGSYLLLIAALLLLGRHGGRAGWIDLLDGALATATVFPPLWFVLIAPILSVPRLPPGTTVLVSISLLLAVALVVKLTLGAGPRWSAGWILFAVVTVLASNAVVFLPETGGPGVPLDLVPVIWVAYPAGLGAAGLHPSMRSITSPPPRPGAQLSIHRLLLLGSLALLVPTGVLAAGLTGMGGPLDTQAGVAVLVSSVIAAALLLMVRLAMAARLAQRQAVRLAEQARELDAAIHEQEALSQQLTYQVLHDPLTGLANRVVLRERLEWVLSRREGTHALLLLDLDGFKDVNDTLGHQVGDELLVAVAQRILVSVPQPGMLARLGGDELAVVLEDETRDRAVAWAGQVVETVRRPFHLDGRSLYQTISVGLAMLESGDGRTTPSDAMRDADLALYAAKDAGKDQVRQFDPAMVEARLSHSRLTTGLRRALANDEFTILYQPVVSLATEQVWAVEALLRWHPSGADPVPPELFIPVAEETGMIADIGRWVLRHACGRARSWWLTRGVAVAVNISARQVVDPDFPQDVADALVAAGLPGEALILEITETSVVAAASADQAVRQLASLREQGVRVAIDDFGTGYSSLSYLARLPVDILKVDSSFARGGPQTAFDPPEWPFVRAIIQLGEGLRLTTVAEGIETTEQADALRRLHCQLAQGYLFSRPVPPEEVDRLLSTPGGGGS